MLHAGLLPPPQVQAIGPGSHHELRPVRCKGDVLGIALGQRQVGDDATVLRFPERDGVAIAAGRDALAIRVQGKGLGWKGRLLEARAQPAIEWVNEPQAALIQHAQGRAIREPVQSPLARGTLAGKALGPAGHVHDDNLIGAAFRGPGSEIQAHVLAGAGQELPIGREIRAGPVPLPRQLPQP